jgi:hypothetical protein
MWKPVSVRLVERKETRIGNQTETFVQVELVDSNSVKRVIDQLSRLIEDGDRITHIMIMSIHRFISKESSSPAESEVIATIVDSAKGEIDGDRRWLTNKSTIVTAAGIHKTAPSRVNVPLENPYAGRSDQEVAEDIFRKVMSMRF